MSDPFDSSILELKSNNLRDFEPIIANFGDTVNTRKPAEFTANRKDVNDSVTIQNASATNIPVVLNQHSHVSFLIRDGEESKSFKDLIAEYIQPAMLAEARLIDQVILGQYPQFLVNSYGGTGLLTSVNGRQYILGTRTTMNKNKAYMDNRHLILTPNSEGTLLNLDLFTAAYAVGDEGTALREASLGRKLGFNMYMCQNMASVHGAATTAAGAVNHSGGYGAGYAGSIVTDIFVGALAIGQFVTVNGYVYQVKAHTETLGATTAVTFTNPLIAAVADDDVITATASAYLVNLVAGYAAGWQKAILVDVGTDTIQVGQVVSFSNVANSPIYTIVQTNGSTSIVLDRPLDVAVVDDAPVYLGPAGDYNFAFHRNAIALVVRPLALPKQGTGALSSVVNYNDLSMRATITYDGNKQGHLVTLDMLFGIAILDVNLGAVMLG